jgi:hypothetical protein
MKSIKKVKYSPDQIYSIVDMFRSNSEGDFELGLELLSRCDIYTIPKDILTYLTAHVGDKMSRETLAYIIHQSQSFTPLNYLMTMDRHQRLSLYLKVYREKYK